MPNHVENYLKIVSNKGTVMPVLEFMAGGNRMFPKYDFWLEYYEAGAGYSGSMYLSEGVVKYDFSGGYCGFRGG